MELDDLKLAWQTLDRRLEQQNAMNLYQFKETNLTKVKSGLRPLLFGQGIQLIIGVLMMLLSAPFWVEHIATPHLLIYGLSLHLYALMLVIFAARDLHMIAGMDYSAPVLTIQKQIAELRSWHLRMGPIFAFSGCVIWVPLTLMVFYWLGADIWLHAPTVVYWFIANSIACIAIIYGFIRWSRHPNRTKLAAYLDKTSVGRSVNRAQAVLSEIKQFEKM